MPKVCAEPGCCKQSAYGPPDGELSSATHCAAHKPDGYENVVSKRCAALGCHKQPSYGPLGGKGRSVATHCADHKPDGYENVVSKRCAALGCRKQPAYGPPGGGGNSASHCVAHKPDGYENVVSKRCAALGCRTRPIFGFPGSGAASATHCAKHAPPEFEDLKNKQCAESGCRSGVSFGPPCGNRATAAYCRKHAPPDFEDVRHKRCAEPGCPIHPTFGQPNGKPPTATHCRTHAPLDFEAVNSKRCVEPGCHKFAHKANPGDPKRYCYEHSPITAVRESRRRCAGCRELATHGTGSIAEYCSEHAIPGCRNIVERECASCHLQNMLDPETGKCSDCGYASVVKAQRLVKQKRIGDVLGAAGLAIVASDRIVDATCNKRRPDFLVDAGTHFLVVEVDEFQHRGAICEERRMFQIAQALGLPTVFIRFNPDNYKTPGGGKGTATVATRERELINWAAHYAKAGTSPVGAHVSVLWLFYDGWTPRQAAVKLELTELGGPSAIGENALAECAFECPTE